MQAISKMQLDSVINELKLEGNFSAENQAGFQMAIDLIKLKLGQELRPIEIELEVDKDGLQVLPRLSRELETGPIGIDLHEDNAQASGFYLSDEIISLITEDLCELNVKVSTLFSDENVQQLCSKVAGLVLEFAPGMNRHLYRESHVLAQSSANKIKSTYLKNFPNQVWPYENW